MDERRAKHVAREDVYERILSDFAIGTANLPGISGRPTDGRSGIRTSR